MTCLPLCGRRVCEDFIWPFSLWLLSTTSFKFTVNSSVAVFAVCCVCPPVTMMSNMPRATLDFARKSYLIRPRSRSLANAHSAALLVACVVSRLPCGMLLAVVLSGALLRARQADRPRRTVWRHMRNAIWLGGPCCESQSA